LEENKDLEYSTSLNARYNDVDDGSLKTPARTKPAAGSTADDKNSNQVNLLSPNTKGMNVMIPVQVEMNVQC
jgi:hypothetical protein